MNKYKGIIQTPGCFAMGYQRSKPIKKSETAISTKAERSLRCSTVDCFFHSETCKFILREGEAPAEPWRRQLGRVRLLPNHGVASSGASPSRLFPGNSLVPLGTSWKALRGQPALRELHIEQEMAYIPILHNVCLSLGPEFTRQANFLLGSVLFQIR